jgi:hypothetical protein
LLLDLDRAVILGSEYRLINEDILLHQISDSPNLEGQLLVFMQQEQGGPVI